MAPTQASRKDTNRDELHTASSSNQATKINRALLRESRHIATTEDNPLFVSGSDESDVDGESDDPAVEVKKEFDIDILATLETLERHLQHNATPDMQSILKLAGDRYKTARAQIKATLKIVAYQDVETQAKIKEDQPEVFRIGKDPRKASDKMQSAYSRIDVYTTCERGQAVMRFFKSDAWSRQSTENARWFAVTVECLKGDFIKVVHYVNCGMMVRLRPEKKARPRRQWMTGGIARARKWAEKDEEPIGYTANELRVRNLTPNELGILTIKRKNHVVSPPVIFPDDHLMGAKRVAAVETKSQDELGDQNEVADQEEPEDSEEVEESDANDRDEDSDEDENDDGNGNEDMERGKSQKRRKLY